MNASDLRTTSAAIVKKGHFGDLCFHKDKSKPNQNAAGVVVEPQVAARKIRIKVKVETKRVNIG